MGDKTSQLIKIKGTQAGLVILLKDGSWDRVQDALMDRVRREAEFLNGARVALEVGSHAVTAAQLGTLCDEFANLGLTIWAVVSDSPNTQASALSLGLATRIPQPEGGSDAKGSDTTFQDGELAILVQRTLRSGYKLQHPGHVTVIGDVNPGAEIIAGGNVVVWGRLRGMVHAGASGDERAVVCALELSPTQLRIAGNIAIPPQADGNSRSEVAFLQDGQVVAEPWNYRREGTIIR